MNNKLCVITGANSGIGFETAKALSKKGAYIVMVCRNEDKAIRAREQIIENTETYGIDIIVCDFAIQSEIRHAAEVIRTKYDQVDVLINNHGLIASERKETVDGLERTFAVNHIGYFLFTHLLLNQLKAAEHARIINVSSAAHRGGTFDTENLQLSSNFSPMKAYANSKLFNILFTKELANRLVDTTVTSNCLHPGVVASNFGQSGKWFIKLIYTLGKPFMISPVKGAKTSVYLASSDDVKNVNGAYFKNKMAATPSKAARNADYAKQLWAISKKLCGLQIG
ncbi:MAG: SDR family oxidoreductase [Balneolaceae bacterium]|nr:SDR family oxidoreductase [Balneolaceae bacterium]